MEIDCMENLLLPNPEIVKYQNRFIQWSNFDDNIIFLKLLTEHVYINGFINEEFVNLRLYNKPIISENSVKDIENACIITSQVPQLADSNTVHLQAFVLNPCLVNANVYIYGCGDNGKAALEYLNNFSLKPKGFIDSDSGKIGKQLYDYNIYSPEIIGKLSQDAIIILAADQYKSMETTVKSYSSEIKMLHFGGHVIKYCNNSINGVALNVTINHVLQGKSVYLYGDAQKVLKYQDFFQLLDFPPQGILMDSEKLSACTIPDAKPVEDILYESNFCIVICSDEENKAIYKLESLGLTASKDFILSSSLRPDKYELRKTALDTNLGYTYLCQNGNYGVSKLVASHEQYKIAILGGSTTDGELYSFKSWPECLWDKIDNTHISIYNYGVAGYGAGQEMIRLIRDILFQKPDLIIAYNGYNDSCEYSYAGTKNLLNFKYLSSVIQFASEHLNDSHGNDKHVYSGEEVFLDSFSRWLAAVDLMQKIASSYHIPFFDFLQPMLRDKPVKTPSELLICKFDVPRKPSDIGFRQPYSSVTEKREYIKDFSDIFDDIPDVYMDTCHVTEAGNQIIANQIYQTIEPIIQNWHLSTKEMEK